MDAGGGESERTDTSGGADTERENGIGGGGCWVDKLEGEEGELIAEGEEKGKHGGERGFAEEMNENDDEGSGDCKIEIGEGDIEGENRNDIKKGFDMYEDCEVEGEVDFEKESDAASAEENESEGANKKVIKDESERLEESDADISPDEVREDNVNNLGEGETTSGMFAIHVEESAGVDDNVTDVVTPALKLLIFNIVMPCVDIYFDSTLILKLYPQFWGCILVIVSGFLLHFTFTCFAWWQAVTKCGTSSKCAKIQTNLPWMHIYLIFA